MLCQRLMRVQTCSFVIDTKSNDTPTALSPVWFFLHLRKKLSLAAGMTAPPARKMSAPAPFFATTTVIPGASCTQDTPTSVTCTGTGAFLGSSPAVTFTDALGNSNTVTVPLNVALDDTNGAQTIPALSQWSLIALALMLLYLSASTLRTSARRR